jgi:hypothetical protein
VRDCQLTFQPFVGEGEGTQDAGGVVDKNLC